jgi:hypothetical protein
MSIIYAVRNLFRTDLTFHFAVRQTMAFRRLATSEVDYLGGIGGGGRSFLSSEGGGGGSDLFYALIPIIHVYLSELYPD